MKWFRFYSEALHDPKVQQLRPELFKFWVNCLCLANERPERGTLPNVDELAFILRMKRPVVERFMVEMLVGGLIHWKHLDPGLTSHCDVSEASLNRFRDVKLGFMIHQWAVRQPSSDDIAKRVKSYREKRSAKPAEADVTLHVTPTDRTCNGLDTELELEENSPPYTPPPQTANGACVRSGEDLAFIRQAEQLLASDLRTVDLAPELTRQHNVAGCLPIAGWKWLRAAQYVLGPGVADSKRRSFKYLATVAANLTDAEREPRPAAKKETVGERRARERAEQLKAVKERERVNG